jgi:hypothetical protein
MYLNVCIQIANKLGNIYKKKRKKRFGAGRGAEDKPSLYPPFVHFEQRNDKIASQREKM